MMLIFNLVLSAYNMFIQNLVLTKNNLTSLPDALFSSLKQLKIVDLSENILESIPGTIGQCDQMEILRIQDNNLADLPMELAQCTNLQVLNISRNLMNKLPVVVPLCTSLEQLYMNDMFMTELPEEIGRKIYETVCSIFLFTLCNFADQKKTFANNCAGNCPHFLDNVQADYLAYDSWR